MRRIAFISTSRADFGLWQPVLSRAVADPRIEPLLVLGGSLIDSAGEPPEGLDTRQVPIAATVTCNPEGDRPLDACLAAARALEGFALSFDRLKPDMVMVLGDRYEMHAAAAAAVPLKIPIAHLHGGEVTLGAMDELFRHSISKLAQLHFVALEAAGQRLCAMGEPPERIIISGAPGLDEMPDFNTIDRSKLGERTGLRIDQPFLLVTVHPETATRLSPEHQIQELLAALDADGRAAIWTETNRDPAGQAIAGMIHQAVSNRPSMQQGRNLGRRRYLELMALCDAVVGNSSSGIIEAAGFGRPVVNIGQRQEGRFRGENVLDCDWDRRSILDALRNASSTTFQSRLIGMPNPYGDGRASRIIIDTIATIDLDRLIPKSFHDTALAGERLVCP